MTQPLQNPLLCMAAPGRRLFHITTRNLSNDTVRPSSVVDAQIVLTYCSRVLIRDPVKSISRFNMRNIKGHGVKNHL